MGDPIRDDLLATFDEMLPTMSKSLRDSVSDGSLLKTLMECEFFEDVPDDVRIQFSINFIQGLVETFEKESKLLVEYWKSHIPREEELETMTDEQVEESVLTPFMSELEKICMSIPHRLAATIQAQLPDQ